MSLETIFTVYKAIIFDMDGVIIDSKELVESFWIEKLEKYGLHIPKESFDERFHGRPARLIIEKEFSGLDEQEQSAMEKEIKEFDSSVDKFDLIPGVEDFMRQCIEYNIPIALVTSALPPKVDRMLASLSIDPPFETVVTANLVSNGKPSPECYRLAIQKLNITPSEAIIFEDSLSGVQAASGAGANVIGVNEPHMEETLKKAGSSLVIQDFIRTELSDHGDEYIYLFPNVNRQSVYYKIER
jgi:HAD superfamily hydrolase (TIGR01509 family)